jgi:hypothetical protein
LKVLEKNIVIRCNYQRVFNTFRKYILFKSNVLFTKIWHNFSVFSVTLFFCHSDESETTLILILNNTKTNEDFVNKITLLIDYLCCPFR